MSWITLDEARFRARMSGATVMQLADIMKRAIQGDRLGITAILEVAPIERVREHWPLHAMRLELMQFWYAPGHIEKELHETGIVAKSTTGLEIEADNKLRALIMWGSGAPPYEADTCVFTQVRVQWADLAAELEAAGFAVESEDHGEVRHTPEPLPGPAGRTTPAVEAMRNAYARLIQEGKITADMTFAARYQKVRASREVAAHRKKTDSTTGLSDDTFLKRVVHQDWPGKPRIATLETD